MSSVTATAPGKVVLLGEYAVLDGEPALSLAVDRRARVSIEACSESACQIAVPQLDMDPVGFVRAPEGAIRWRCPQEVWPRFERTARLIEFLLAHVQDQYGDPGPFRMTIDTSELFEVIVDRSVKLGLGSSAAVAVALDAAMTRFAAGTPVTQAPDLVLARLLAPYRAAQRGMGSGIDLATSLNGGLIEYRVEDALFEVRKHALPGDLHLLFVWTGEAASTTDLISIYRDWCEKFPVEALRLRKQMAVVCRSGILAVRQNDARLLGEQIGAYGQIMGTMSGLVKAPVVTAAHRQAMAQAHRLGAAYKPCGAGGGDLGLAACVDPAVLERLAGDLEQMGLQVMSLALDCRGVEIATD